MKNANGFTLVELIVTIAIAGILVTVAVPSFINLMANNRMAAQANDFMSSIQLARTEAVTRGQRVSVCKSATGTSCTTAGTYAQGWIVFSDAGTAGSVDAGDAVIRAYGALLNGSTLVGAGAVSNFVSFRPNGFTTLAAGTNSLFSLCPATPAPVPGRDIQVAASGRARVQNPPAAACP